MNGRADAQLNRAGASCFATMPHELESETERASSVGTVPVTAPSKGYGTSTPGVLAAVGALIDTRYRVIVTSLFEVGTVGTVGVPRSFGTSPQRHPAGIVEARWDTGCRGRAARRWSCHVMHIREEGADEFAGGGAFRLPPPACRSRETPARGPGAPHRRTKPWPRSARRERRHGSNRCMLIARSLSDDAWRDEDQELPAHVIDRLALEQPVDQRDLTQPGSAVRRVSQIARIDAADDGGLPVVDEQRRDRALCVDRRNAAGPAARLKSGVAFSSRIFMITVSAAVICGVTFNDSAASLNVVVTVLFAIVCNGNLRSLGDFGLDVVQSRDARRRQDAGRSGSSPARTERDVEVEGAVDRSRAPGRRRSWRRRREG